MPFVQMPQEGRKACGLAWEDRYSVQGSRNRLSSCSSSLSATWAMAPSSPRTRRGARQGTASPGPNPRLLD